MCHKMHWIEERFAETLWIGGGYEMLLELDVSSAKELWNTQLCP
jgi:hypothetical protein